MKIQTPRWLALAACAGAATVAAPAWADVTTEQQMTFDLSIIKAHGTTTEYTTADKQRSDTALHCEGLLSLVCGNAESGQIVRLDRDVTWELEPKKKQYRETAFLTAAQRQQLEQQMQAAIDKAKQCPVSQNAAPAPDTSKCQMSPPQFDSRQTNKHATLVGHDAQLSQLALTQSCKNAATGDECDFVITLDAWLTQDQIAGLEDQRAFRKAYMQKLGLDEQNSLVTKQLRQFLAPYAANLKDLGARASDFKGYPLKTAVRISFGGPHCAAAQKEQTAGAPGGGAVTDASHAAGEAAADSAAGAAGSAAGTAAGNAAGNSVAGSVLGSAAGAFGSKLVSGLFHKKADAAPAPATSAAAPEGTLGPGMVQAAEFSFETTSITPGPVPAAQFEVPADWKLIPPAKERTPKEFSCPKS